MKALGGLLSRDDYKLTRRFLTVALGQRGALLLLAAVGAPFLLTIADLGIAALLVLFLKQLGLTAPAQPAWLPSPLANAGWMSVWGCLLALVGIQSLLHVAAYQAKILLTEGVHLRMRLLVSMRLLPLTGVPSPLSRINHFTAEVLPKTSGFFFFGAQLLAFLVQTTTIAFTLLWMAPGEALIGLVGFAGAAWWVLLFSRQANRAAARMPTNHLLLEQTKVRASRNWLLIRTLHLQERERARYAKACHDYFKASVESFFYANLGLAVTPLFAVLVLAVTTIAWQWIFHTPSATFVAFLYLFVRFQYLVAHGSHLVGGLFSSGPAVREASHFIADLSPAELEGALAYSTDARLPANSGFVPPTPGIAPAPPRIEAQEVSFRWNPEDRPVLDGLSFHCSTGRQLGIMGPNGSGKSTLLALLLGVLRQAQGRLLLDGLAASEWVAQHAHALSYAGAEAFLIAGSVRENLVYGLEKPWTDEGLLEVVERVGLNDCIRSLPNGLDHMLTEDGVGLSSGEKQKLALARALLRSPSLLVLDEPTANVDEASERDIVETLACLRGSCTVVVVSHEPRVLRYADDRIVLGPR